MRNLHLKESSIKAGVKPTVSTPTPKQPPPAAKPESPKNATYSSKAKI